jgi:group I intron endonuclease
MYFIYLIQNKLDLKIYVGQTRNPKIRWNQHKVRAKNNSPQYIHNAMRFHGVDNFTFQIIEEYSLEKDVNEAEEFWIQFFQTRDSNIGYNLTSGGCGSRGFKHSKESKIKMSKIRSEYYSDPIAIQNQSAAAIKHYKENADTINKISSSLKEFYKNPEARENNSKAQLKYYLDNPDSGKKNSFSKKRKYSTEVIEEIKNLHNLGWKNIDIAKKLDIHPSYISGVICGTKRKYE